MKRRITILNIGLSGILLVATPALAQSADFTALHDALRLTAPQETAWRTYLSETAQSAKAQDRRQAGAKLLPKLNAPRRLALIEAEMEQDLSDLKREERALNAFYATLDPEQQRIFDAQTLPPQQNQ